MNEPETLCRFLLQKFPDKLIPDQYGCRDSRNSSRIREDDEDMGFTVREPFDAEDLRKAISDFYEAQGLNVKLYHKSFWLEKNGEIHKFVTITYDRNRLKISVKS
ncbi:MAG: hypothetical protein WDN47_02935 [Candidatus Doudnabacteria bacterium]